MQIIPLRRTQMPLMHLLILRQLVKAKSIKKTQSTSSPGILGEDANRNKKKSSDPIGKDNNKTHKEEGLNEARSAGNAGAFEGLENTGDS
jgi:hypothetical protein